MKAVIQWPNGEIVMIVPRLEIRELRRNWTAWSRQSSKTSA